MHTVKVRRVITAYASRMPDMKRYSYEQLGSSFEVKLTDVLRAYVGKLADAGLVGPCDFVPVFVEVNNGVKLVVCDEWDKDYPRWYADNGGSPLSNEDAIRDAEDRLAQLMGRIHEAEEEPTPEEVMWEWGSQQAMEYEQNKRMEY